MRILLTPLVVLVASMILWAQDSQNLHKEISKIIRYDTEISFDKTPGFLIGVIDGDSTYFLRFGAFTDSLPEGKFFLGGASKTVAAALVQTLVEKGTLRYEQRIAALFPDCNFPDDITIRDLLSHQTNFHKTPTNLGKHQSDPRNPYGDYGTDELQTYICDLHSTRKADFQYSHVNYALLELILERVTGSPFDTLLSSFSEELGLPVLVNSREQADLNMVNGHDRSCFEASPWTFASFSASEGICSDIETMVDFVQWHLKTKRFDNLLIKQTETPYDPKIFVGLSWHIFDYRRYPFYSHSGKAGGHYAFMGFAKATDTGVVILANSSVGTEDLGILVLRMINKNWKRKPIPLKNG